MKKRCALFPAIMMTVMALSASAQTFFCSAFSVTNVYPDTITAGDYWISIQCIAGPNEFVSYPIVSTVVDGNGDTVATGGLFYFGQFGQTTQDYPVTLTGNGSLTGYPLTAYFIINYDPGFTDTCQLNYGTSGLIPTPASTEKINLYPNPARHTINVSVDESMVGAAYHIRDLTGRTVLQGELPASSSAIALDDLCAGTYSISVGERLKRPFLIVKE
ncbi:MAG: hypothetical protein RL213_1124 [Bacteroidota bacterium]|jgi:hypothetical protein